MNQTLIVGVADAHELVGREGHLRPAGLSVRLSLGEDLPQAVQRLLVSPAVGPGDDPSQVGERQSGRRVAAVLHDGIGGRFYVAEQVGRDSRRKSCS